MKNLSPAARPSSFSLRAPAKINWFLTILGKRKDGYHNIISLMQCISLYDKLSFKKADSLVISSDLDIPVEINLVHKAASLFKKYTSCNDGAKITLQKNIPVSAGLGGGSSDAAYTLLGLNILWSIGLNNRELSTIGRKIGSDVPFFLNSSFALVEGRGERVVPLKHNKSAIVLLLVKPGMSVSTAWAYEYFDKIYTDKLTKKPVDIKLFCQALSKRDFTSLSTFLSNDLEKVVIEKYPVVGKIKERLLENGALISSMTGSGPTVFGVFESKKTALAAAYRMGADNWYGVAETIV
ncbi:MAG: 4-(cytidine 5'-diphospho)-2-C-methyl-D-erythritol kinase [Nitrospirae bacterium RBG_13_39_12]|nr:MAG: 4-(cytidine 5'-diphospho)-2-C-methyl-D-erythritol kinase [Nitrospirae bacterium RBG_13_39_12]